MQTKFRGKSDIFDRVEAYHQELGQTGPDPDNGTGVSAEAEIILFWDNLILL